MKKWLLRVGICFALGGGLWYLSTFKHTYDYPVITNIVEQQNYRKGKLSTEGNDGWQLPIIMR